MKFDGIDGDSTAEGFHGFFDVFAFSWGVSNQGTHAGGGGGGAGKVSMQDLHFVKQTGKSSPKLLLACCQGKHLPAVQLEVTRPSGEGGQNSYLRYKLENVMITSYQVSGDGGSAPTESLSLNFTKITYTQFVPRPDGTNDSENMNWDFSRNVGG
jgi:type VI secretion system secreted protein Hcp